MPWLGAQTTRKCTGTAATAAASCSGYHREAGTAMEPLNFLAGTESLGNLREGWTLDEAPHGSPERAFRTRVNFNRSFQGAPLVHLGIAGLDASNQDSTRLTASADNVTPEGFEIVLTTWLHSKLWRVDVNWLAIGS